MGLTFRLGQLPTSLFTDSSLNVGIGAAPSGSYKLEVTGTAKVSSTLLVSGAATFGSTITASGNLNLQAGATRNINFYDSSNTNINAQIQYDQISATSGQLFFGTNNAGTFATRLTIASTGVATFSSGQINITGSGTSIQLQGTSYGNIAADKTLYLDSGASSDMILRTNGGSERMRITSGGAVQINLTTGGATLNMKSVSSGALIKCVNAANGDGTIFAYGTSTTFDYAFNTYSVANAFYLYNNGNYDFAGSDVSDLRLKENIKTIDYNAIEKLMQLVPKSYNMIKHPDIKRSGFIAQEVQQVLPDLINGIEGEDEFLGLDYNGILAIAVKAIQELSNRLIKAGL
jgi:hypothetical protein